MKNKYNLELNISEDFLKIILKGKLKQLGEIFIFGENIIKKIASYSEICIYEEIVFKIWMTKTQ